MRYLKTILLVTCFSIIANKGYTQCYTISLSSSSGSTCVTTSITVSNNTFSGGATSVAITENGAGSVTPALASVSPFSFTYTPAAGDAGNTVTITFITDNPLGGTCVPATATYTLTVNALPSAIISYTGNPFCRTLVTEQPVTLTGTSGGSFSSAPVGSSINSATGAIIPGASTAGTYTVTYTVSVAGCGVATATTPVTITALPVATFSYTGTPYCNNESNPSPTFSGGGVAGTFSSTTGLVFTNTATGRVDLSASTPGTYIVTNTIAAAGGCEAVTATAPITITALPVATFSYSGTPYCSNESDPLPTYSGGGGAGVFSSTAGLVFVSITTGQVDLSASTAGTYTVTNTRAAAGGCNIVTATSTITVTAMPAATILYAGNPFCNTLTGTRPVTRTGTAGGTYSATPAGLTINASTGAITPSTSTAGTYTVTYTIAAAGGCGVVTATTSVTITSFPSATISYTGSPWCSTAGVQNVTLTGTGGGTFSAPAGLSLNSATGAITPGTSVAGTYTVTYTVEAVGCGTATANTSVTITSLPTAAISYLGSPWCSTAGVQNVSLTGTSGGTYSAAPAGLTINPTTGAITPSTSTAGTYTVTYTIAVAGGCVAVTATTVVRVNATPLVVITNPSAVCSPATVDLTAPALTVGSTSGLTFTYWTDAAATIAYATPLAATAGTYYIKGTTAAGCFDVKPVVVTVNQSPTATASNNGPVCVASPLTLTGGPAAMTTYLWTGPNSFTSSLQSPAVSPSATLAMAGVYTLTVTNSTGCQDTATTRAYVYTVPVSNAGTGGTECDLNFILNAVPSVGTGLWIMVTGSGTATFSPNANAATATVTVSAYGTYTFRWTETNGTCVSSSVVTVNFYQQPVANAGTGGDACNLNFALNAIPSAGIGTWTMTSGTGTATFTPNVNSPVATVTVSEYGTKEFTWTEVNGICSGFSTITVNFYEQPVANAGLGGNNCGLEFDLSATPSVGIGTWTRDSGPGSVSFSPNANNPSATAIVTAYGNHVFRWTEVNGTCSSSATVAVTFIQQPRADGGPGGNECDLNFVLKAVPGSGTGTWTKVGGPGTVVFSPNVNQYNATVTVSQFGSYDFAWTEVNSLCSSTDIVRVTFHDLPTVNAGTDMLLCKGKSTQLNASGTGSFSWTPVSLLNNPYIYNPVATPEATTAFTVTLTDQWGCKNSDQVNVEVRVQPIADAGPDQELEFLFETDLVAVAPGTNQTGEWTLLEGEGEISDVSNPSTHVNNLSIDVNSFIWNVSNGICTVSTDTVNVIVHNLIIPTLITPNLDGNNDYFVIKGIESFGETSLTVFNRWGARVYENSEYDNSWEGVDDKENPLPEDTYFYVLKPEKSKTMKGYVVIRR